MTLPRGWVDATIEDVAIYVSRGKSPKYVDRSNLPVVNQRAVRWSGVDSSHLKFVDPNTAHQWSEERTLKAGDLLWNSTGTGTIGRAALYHPLPGFDRVVADSHVTIVRVEPAINPAYLFAWIKSPAVQSVLDEMQSGSTNQIELNRAAVLATPVPLPPIAEQRRIVAKLDALTARLARTRAELDRVPVLAARLRRAALRHAFRGPPSIWSTLGEGGLVIEAGKNLKCEERPPQLHENGVVKVSAVSGEKYLPLESKTLPVTYVPAERDRIRPGDLLLARASGSLSLVGRVALVTETPDNIFLSDKVLRLRVPPDTVEWVYWFMRSTAGRDQIEEAASGISMHNITQEGLKAIRLPFPDADARSAILEKVRFTFARADRLEAEAVRARTLLDRLESAILAKAFRGELVPQEPNDEPASVVLERIRAQRAAAPKTKRGRRAKAEA